MKFLMMIMTVLGMMATEAMAARAVCQARPVSKFNGRSFNGLSEQGAVRRLRPRLQRRQARQHVVSACRKALRKCRNRKRIAIQNAHRRQRKINLRNAVCRTRGARFVAPAFDKVIRYRGLNNKARVN